MAAAWLLPACNSPVANAVSLSFDVEVADMLPNVLRVLVNVLRGLVLGSLELAPDSSSSRCLVLAGRPDTTTAYARKATRVHRRMDAMAG